MKKTTAVLLFALFLCLSLTGICSAEVCLDGGKFGPSETVMPGDSVKFYPATRYIYVYPIWATHTPTPMPVPTDKPTAVPTRPGKPSSGGQPNIPNTGDNTHLGLWFGILGGSAALIAAAAVWNKHRS